MWVRLPITVNPHVRGEHLNKQKRDSVDVRLIPTFVGNTGPLPREKTTRSVNPHVRGEHSINYICGARNFG